MLALTFTLSMLATASMDGVNAVPSNASNATIPMDVPNPVRTFPSKPYINEKESKLTPSPNMSKSPATSQATATPASTPSPRASTTSPA